jgi:cell division transport system ATP-binding protein
MRYGTGPEVLREVTFSLAPGSFHFLTGRSGAGKSSLLKLMYLAHRPSRGLITLFDEDIATTPHKRLPLLRRRICRSQGFATARCARTSGNFCIGRVWPTT